MFFIAQATPVYNLFVQTLTVLLPMVLTGAYSMFCWLLAEPIVMPIWNNLIKPAYDGLLLSIHNFGMGCARKWRDFWNSPAAPQTAVCEDIQTRRQAEQPTKTFRQRIFPLLFRPAKKSASETSSPSPIQVASPRLPGLSA